MYNAAAANGRDVYFCVVDEGGDAENPFDWLGGGIFTISGGSGSAVACEVINPLTLQLGDPITFPGGYYKVYLMVDIAGDGPPPDDGIDKSGEDYVITFGNETIWFDYENELVY